MANKTKKKQITPVNTHFCAKKVSTVLGYFDIPKSKNVFGSSELALVLEIFYIFVSKSAKKTQILTLAFSLCYNFDETISIFLCLILSFLM